jgi:DNA-binding transcriptional MerR regulator
MREPETTYLTTSDLARRFDRSPDRVRQLARAGRITPAIVTSRGERLYTSAEADRFERSIKRGTRS